MRLELLGEKVSLGNLHLLFQGVTGNLDDFHAIQERAIDRILAVGRGDKQNIRQIKGRFGIVIAETCVLFGIEHFQQR